MGEILSDRERQYIYSFKPAGFVRSWHALYSSKCHAGPWTLSRRLIVFGAIEKGNRLSAGSTQVSEGIIGWHVSIPVGVGTVALWGYRRQG